MAIAMLSFTISALFTISAIMLNDCKSLWNHFFTFIISTPHLRRYAAASKVLTPVLNVKLFVSIIIPAYKLSASIFFNSTFTSVYCNNSVTNSAAEEAYTSWNVNVASSI